jgi:hypothetical protein
VLNVIEDREAEVAQERRSEARYKLILRVGVLEQSGRSSLCLVKNISSMGAQVKFYVQPVVGAEVSIRVADESPVHGQLAWVSQDMAGISFQEELDTATLLRVQQKLRSNRRRAIPRVNVDAIATLRSGGRTCRATLCDISSVGARVRTHGALVAGDIAMVTFADLPAIKAYVRWTAGDESGLAFETPMPIHVIARWIDGRVRLSA